MYVGAVVVTALCVAAATTVHALAVPLAGLILLVIAVVAYGPERVGNAFMIICVLTAPMMRVRPLYPMVSFITASDLAWVIGAALLAPTLLSRRFRVPPYFLFGWVLIIFGGVLGTLVASPEPVTSLNYLTRFVIAGLFLPILFLMWAPTLRQVRLGAAAYVVGQVISTAYALVEGPMDNDRYFGLTTHSLFFGPAGVLATGCALYLLGRATKASHRAALVIGLGICMASMVMSGSRACLATAVLLYIIFAITHRSLITIWWLLAGAVALAISFQRLLAVSSKGSAITRLAGNNSTEYADTQRTNAFLDALSDVAHHPFAGHGYLTILDVHNVPLEMLVGGGVLGFIGFVLTVYPMVRHMFWIPQDGGLSLIPIAWLITAMTVPRLWDRIIWVGLALALAGLTVHTRPAVERLKAEEAEGTGHRDDPAHAALRPVLRA